MASGGAAAQSAPHSLDLESLMDVHSAELSVLRQLEKWLEHRADIDRQYADALAKNGDVLRNIVPSMRSTLDSAKRARASKGSESATDWRDLPAVKLCDLLATYTESVSSAVRENAEELRRAIRVKLDTLIEEKECFDVVCDSKRSVMLFDLHRTQQEAGKQRIDYARVVEQTAQSQARYEALVVQQRAAKLHAAKENYFRNVAHLHVQHNRYCVAVRVANQCALDYNSALQPNLATFAQECLESHMLTCKCLAERVAAGFERRAAHLVTAATQLRSQLNAFLEPDPLIPESPSHTAGVDNEAPVNQYLAYLDRRCTRRTNFETIEPIEFDTSLLTALGNASGLAANELSVNELMRERFAQLQRRLLERIANTEKDIELRRRDRLAYERECTSLAAQLQRSSAECVSSPDEATFHAHFEDKLTLFAKQRKLMNTNHELATLHVRLRRDKLVADAFDACAARFNAGVGVYPPALAPFASELNEQLIQIGLAELDDYDEEDELLGGLRRRLTGLRSRFWRHRQPLPVQRAKPYASVTAQSAATAGSSSPQEPASQIVPSATVESNVSAAPSLMQPQRPGPTSSTTSMRVEVMEIDEDSSLVRRSKPIDPPQPQTQAPAGAKSHSSAVQHPLPPLPPAPAEPHSALAIGSTARQSSAKPNAYTDNAKLTEQTGQSAGGSQARVSGPLTTDQMVALSDEEWFHGVLPREEVQRLLVADGDYLLRESRNKQTGDVQLVLSVQWRGHKHFIVQGSPGAWKFEGVAFPTVRELIEAQQRSGAPITAKSGAILRHAILRASWQIKNDDVLLETRIGQGNFGEVYKGRYKGRVVAIKKCKETLDGDARSKFLQEGTILRNYDHPNIVKLIGIAAQRNPIMIVMEYVEGGSLLNYLKANRSKLTTIQMVRMCVDAAAGMTYLESRSCIHRDLAARNCLIAHDLTVKIADFGMSREEEVYEVSDGLKQIPIKWTAPEALNLAKYTSKCDVWSFGILMWEVFSGGATPYANLTNQAARERIERGYRLPAPDSAPEQLYSIMLRCWLANPGERPTFRTLLTELRMLEKHLAPPGMAVSVSVTDLLALQSQPGLNASSGSFSLLHNGDDIQVNDEDI